VARQKGHGSTSGRAVLPRDPRQDRALGHQTLKNRILLEHYYLPGELEVQVQTFVDHYNHRRYHESLDNLTPADDQTGAATSSLAMCPPGRL
jgi:transposase InsO family protein